MFACWKKNNFTSLQCNLSVWLTRLPYLGFTASEVWLNSGSLTCCYVLALSLQIQDYCLLCAIEEVDTLRKQGIRFENNPIQDGVLEKSHMEPSA